MILLRRITATAVLFFVLFTSALAQFDEPEIKKVPHDQRQEFMQRFSEIKWTGQGLYQETQIDRKKTDEVRARLQARYGDPTQTLEDLINEENFRPGKAIQFEYWFTVDDSIPMMVLDIDGPFGQGLVYGGASQYIDLMPQIKRTLSQKLMSVDNLGEFQDYFYSPEREQWFNVRYQNGELTTREIDSPEGMTIEYTY
ncbi:hypothetical protein NC796_19190 [Aliifodinibius sp. S!AR15-10]|uniref:hypothetical protein n=1 Tax=Aliifodinibius sp. S!AR15-10 TaxID=2950437 RepID=UPI00285CDF79|nr:hypothetical protein [Aliifodinibius sp. S!AR15-10]MDR8393288.1 hypothetical protein [Aliifodinibius sp. S!AR15-10]